MSGAMSGPLRATNACTQALPMAARRQGHRTRAFRWEQKRLTKHNNKQCKSLRMPDSRRLLVRVLTKVQTKLVTAISKAM
jgi:hypothetical protein